MRAMEKGLCLFKRALLQTMTVYTRHKRMKCFQTMNTGRRSKAKAVGQNQRKKSHSTGTHKHFERCKVAHTQTTLPSEWLSTRKKILALHTPDLNGEKMFVETAIPQQSSTRHAHMSCSYLGGYPLSSPLSSILGTVIRLYAKLIAPCKPRNYLLLSLVKVAAIGSIMIKPFDSRRSSIEQKQF